MCEIALKATSRYHGRTITKNVPFNYAQVREYLMRLGSVTKAQRVDRIIDNAKRCVCHCEITELRSAVIALEKIRFVTRIWIKCISRRRRERIRGGNVAFNKHTTDISL